MAKRVIIVGAGLAGMVAALAAEEEGADIILIDRGSVGTGTNTALAGGVFAGPGSDYTQEEYIKETIEIGRMINCEPRVRLVAQEAPGAFQFLRLTGLPIIENHGFLAVRTSQLDIIPGMLLVKNVARKIEKSNKVNIVTNFYVTDIIQSENRVCGVKGFDKNGKTDVVFADAVVLAAGGAGALYLLNDNQKNTMGQGYRLAAKAGLELLDMEFVQFYPIVIADKHLPSIIAYPPFSGETKLINGIGEDILKKYSLGNLNEAIHKKRDEFSVMLFKEISTNGAVFMDLRKVPPSAWKEYPLAIFAKLKFDFRTKPVKISPAAHFFMGGVKTGQDAQTSLSGLFACGEVAWGLHGANRRGGNALTECLVMGKIAGRNAARHAISKKTDSEKAIYSNLSPDKDEVAKYAFNFPAMTSCKSEKQHASGASLREIRQKIRETAWNHAGAIRHEEGLNNGLAKVEKIESKIAGFAPQSVSEMRTKEDLLSASFVLKAIISASIGRQESRGSFQRTDFPDEDNKNYRKNSCLSYNHECGDFSLRYI